MLGEPNRADLKSLEAGHPPLRDVATRWATSGDHLCPRIPDHELIRSIGKGAYGEVWLARNVTGSFRAIKVVHRDSFDSDRPYLREFEGIKRFEPVSHARESQVDIFHVGINPDAGYFYYIMELADDAGEETSFQGSVSSVQQEGSKVAMPPEPQTENLKLETHLQSTGRRGDGAGRPSAGNPQSAIANPQSYVPHTLKYDLQQHGRLPLDQCIQIGLALTTALEHLHANGLVHRDIKPSNVIFVNGVPKLADIGLVAAVDATLSFVGTAGYVPPEGPGKPTGDLYSLGKVLYEISVGRDTTNFPELPTAWEEFADQQGQLEFNAIVLKACAHDPRQRYESAREMHDDLALLQRGKSVRAKHTRQQQRTFALRVGVTTLAILIVGGLGYALRRGDPPAVPVAGDRASIFVLPFRNADTNRVQVDLRDRITDAFIDSLALIDGVRVGPRKSGWVYRNEDEVRCEVGQAFNVRHALSGRVATPPGQVRIELSLYETDGDRKLWSETFVGSTNEIVELETRAIRRIASALRLEITDVEQQMIHQKLTNNLEALRLYRQGYALCDEGTKPGWTRATEAFGRALDLDPHFLAADVGAAWIVINEEGDRPHRQTKPQIKAHMQNVLRMDDTHPGARYFMWHCKGLYDWDWEGFATDFEELRRLNPEVSWAIAYRILGRRNEARLEQEKWEQEHPTTVVYYFHSAAGMLYTERRYDDAIGRIEQGLRRYPNHPFLVALLGQCWIVKQEYLKAIEVLERGLKVERKQDLLALLACAYAKMGDQASASNRLQELTDLSRATYVQPYYLARIHAALGQKQEVWNYLEKAVEEKSEFLVHADIGGLRTDPAWDGLRDEPKFQELLKKVRLDVWPR